jgi:hypothetical protein
VRRLWRRSPRSLIAGGRTADSFAPEVGDLVEQHLGGYSAGRIWIGVIERENE